MNILSYRCQAKFKLVTIEACRSNQTQSPNEIQGRVLEIIPTPSAGIALFMSCAEGEDSCEDLASGKGYFSENLAAALSGEADSDHDGNLTLFEVCKWTTEQTLEQARTKHNKIQRPYFIGSVSDFTLTEAPNVSKAQSAAEEARNAVKTKDYMLAIKKYDEAIALYPRFTSWTIERTMAQELLKSSTSGGNNQTPSVIPSLQAQSITPPPVSPQSESPSEEEQPPVRLSLVQKPSEPYKPGDLMVYKVNGVEFAFRWCPPGRFTMGSPTSEKGRANNNYTNETQHLVTLTKGFWLMETEVTQLQWKAVMGYIPNCRYRGDNLPVESVSWDVCQQFCQKCTEIGLPIQLPTEAQWEYACRAGIMDTYAGNLDEIAWYNERSGKTHPVGTKKPNQWNLYDMHGNVFEWCQDWKGKYSNYPEVDPTGPSSGSFHVYRGGSFCSNFRDCRSAYRNSYSPGFRNNDLVGFRCVNIYAPRLDSVPNPAAP